MTRVAFEYALNRSPGDQACRLVFADWLDEHAEADDDLILAHGMRWEVKHDRRPRRRSGRRLGRGWIWSSSFLGRCGLNNDLLQEIAAIDSDSIRMGFAMTRAHYFPSRYRAELHLALALFRRGEISIRGMASPGPLRLKNPRGHARQKELLSGGSFTYTDLPPTEPAAARVFTNCNVCGQRIDTDEEDLMGMCIRCAPE